RNHGPFNTDYVIIAGSTVGAVVLILIFVNLIKCLRKKNRKCNEDNEQNDYKSDRNAVKRIIQMNASSNVLYTTENNEYMHASGMPELTKDHRFYKVPQEGAK
ncbi:hypothetical protein ACJMK2_014424, partial [Sinanodonta woodiana]